MTTILIPTQILHMRDRNSLAVCGVELSTDKRAADRMHLAASPDRFIAAMGLRWADPGDSMTCADCEIYERARYRSCEDCGYRMNFHSDICNV